MPVLCGIALRNMGVRALLNAVVAYLPSPLDVKPMVGHDPSTARRSSAGPTSTEPMAALIFKISTDPYVGKLSFFRVYSGVVRRGETVYNASTGKTERVGRLVRMHADHREEVDEIKPAISAPCWASKRPAPAKLCDLGREVVLEEISFPRRSSRCRSAAERRRRASSAPR